LKGGRARVPMTRFVLESLVLAAFWMGCEARDALEAEFWWGAALAWWVCFEGLLRPSELLNLRVMDILFPQGADPGAVLVIQMPKTRRIWKTQFVLLDNPGLVAWLEWWLEGRGPNEAAFPLVARRWRQAFKTVAEFMGVSNAGFSLGSLRSGGATNHFRVHRNLGHLQFLGRWRSAKTLEHYLHEAYAAMTAGSLSASSKKLMEQLHLYLHWLNAPPALSARRWFRLLAA
jgi:hypothetical protein